MSDTRPLPRVPVRRRAVRGLVRDFTIIFTVWAVTAYPILWFAANVAGPALFGGTR